MAIVPNICVIPYLASRYRGVAATKEILVADKTFIFLFVLGWLPAHLLTLALRARRQFFAQSPHDRAGGCAAAAVAPEVRGGVARPVRAGTFGSSNGELRWERKPFLP